MPAAGRYLPFSKSLSKWGRVDTREKTHWRLQAGTTHSLCSAMPSLGVEKGISRVAKIYPCAGEYGGGRVDSAKNTDDGL